MSQLGFDFGAAPRRLTKVTPARLATFDDCPRRYRMKYLDRPSPRRTGPWAHSTLGAIVHNALRALFALPYRRRTPQLAATLVGEHWSDAGFADQEQAAGYRNRAKSWVRNYVEKGHVRVEPVGVERWVSAPVHFPERSSRLPLLVEGRADRIDERCAELVIVDYKTGRHKPDSADAHGAQALALYAVASGRMLRMPCRKVELHHLPTATVAEAEHTEGAIREHLERAEETADRLTSAADRLSAGTDADALFPARVGHRCGWCDFRPSCPEGQGFARAARSWDLLAP